MSNKIASPETTRIFGTRYEKDRPMVISIDQIGILSLCVSFARECEDDREALVAYYPKTFAFRHATPLSGFDNDEKNTAVLCNGSIDRYEHSLYLGSHPICRAKFGG